MIVFDPNKPEVVRYDDIAGQFLVAFDLIGFEHLIEIGPDSLHLDIAKDCAIVRYLEVGRAAALAFRFVLDGRSIGKRVQQTLERRAARVFSMLVQRRFAKCLKIGIEFIDHARLSPCTVQASSRDLR
jgi:hypothetical protein